MAMKIPELNENLNFQIQRGGILDSDSKNQDAVQNHDSHFMRIDRCCYHRTFKY